MGRLNDQIAIVTGAGVGHRQGDRGKLCLGRGHRLLLHRPGRGERQRDGYGVAGRRRDPHARYRPPGRPGDGQPGLQAVWLYRHVSSQQQRLWGQGQPVHRFWKPADWDRAIAVNLYGVLHWKAVLPVMAGQGSGAVVNLGVETPGGSARPARRLSCCEGRGHRFHQSCSPGRWHVPRQVNCSVPVHLHRAVRVEQYMY